MDSFLIKELHKQVLSAFKCNSKSDLIKFYEELITSSYLPDKLYNFQSIQNLFSSKINNILNKECFLGKYQDFNDPFDTIALTYSIKKIKENKNLTHNEKTNKLNTLNGVRIGCLSEIRPSEHNSILMWSHYANNHKGICVEYNTRDIITAVINVLKLPEVTDLNNWNIFMVLPVDYIINLRSTNPEVTMLKYPDWFVNIFKKLNHWEYEKEWRITYGHEYIETIPLVPQKIYCGCRILDKDKLLIEKLCNNSLEITTVKADIWLEK